MIALPRNDSVMRLHVGCAFTYRAEIATPTVFQIQPSDSRVAEAWMIEPPSQMRHYQDLYRNLCMRTVLPAGRSTMRYAASVDVPTAPEELDLDAPEIAADDLPGTVLLYTLPSRYCLPDVLADAAWARFGASPPGYQRVRAICAHVHQHLRFRHGSTTPLSTAADVDAGGFGVCRDFAHLAISFCRALNIPARYVFGYLPAIDVPPDPGPMDFAAWMEVWLGDRWWTFDPRNNTRRKGRIVIGTGRDAADVAMATTFGGPELESMTVHAESAVQVRTAG